MNYDFNASNSISFEPVHFKIVDNEVYWKVNCGVGMLTIGGITFSTTSKEYEKLFKEK